jgi:hypothetical protein
MGNKSNLPFIKWFIIFGAIVASLAIAGFSGALSLIWKSDVSHLSAVIGVLFIAGSVLAGKVSYSVSSMNVPAFTTKEKRQMNVLEFLADVFFLIGLAGTIIGFCYMMQDSLQGSDVNAIIAKLKSGSSTKLYTTLAGISASALLRLQMLVIKNTVLDEQ